MIGVISVGQDVADIDLEREKVLVRQAQEGDLGSFSVLVELYEERVIHMAYSFVGHWEDAKDMAQEIFIKLYKSLDSFHEEARFSTWLYRIVANHCKDFLRKKNVNHRLFVGLGPPGENGGDPLESVQAPDRNPRQALMDQEIESTIYRALDKLPLQQRSVFILRYLEGMKFEEIAQTLSLSLGAVKAHLWQAGQKMKKILGPHLQDEGGSL